MNTTDETFDLSTLETRPVLSEISVLIPTLGRDMLAGCLDAIAQGTAWPARLVVVDQSSSPRVESWLASLEAHGLPTLYVPSTQRGVAAGANRGLEHITTPYVAMTHDDCQVAPDWLQQLFAKLRARPDAILTGRVDPGGEGVVVSVKTSPLPAAYTRPQLSADVLYPNNMGCALAIFERVGPFDERFERAAEDNDWSYRALRAGIPIHYEPDVRVTHLDWRDADQLAATYRIYARSQGAVYGKFLRRGDAFMALRVLIALARAVRRWLTGALQADRDKIDRGRAFFMELPAGIIAGWRGKAVS